MPNYKDLNIDYKGGSLEIFKMQLDSLNCCPEVVSGDFECDGNYLTNLVGGPKEVFRNYDCDNNKLLLDLAGGAQYVGGSFLCRNNILTSLVGGPQKVDGNYMCSNNQLTSLDGCASHIGGKLFCSTNNITSLVGIHKIIKRCPAILFDHDKITQGGIGLLLIENLKVISNYKSPPFEIIAKYIGSGTKGMMECSKELIAMGYENYAKL